MLRYKNVEAALAAVLEIKLEEMGAFRARLRHLRNLGLPKLPTPGSGQRIAYTEKQAFTMQIALELEDLGIAPRSAAAIAMSIVRMHRSPGDILAASGAGDVRVAVAPRSAEQWTTLFTDSALREYLASGERKFSLLNLSICARRLDGALREVETGE